eukprot:4584242-Pyramimonas_sp.AAC.1
MNVLPEAERPSGWAISTLTSSPFWAVISSQGRPARKIARCLGGQRLRARWRSRPRSRSRCGRA